MQHVDRMRELEAENTRLKAELAERDATYQRIINEQCPTDEQHCACVPALRQENARLKAVCSEVMYYIADMGLDHHWPERELYEKLEAAGGREE